LGRDLSGNAANVTVNLVEPATLYGDRNNQLDFRFAKILRLGRTKTQVGLDLYNATNTAGMMSQAVGAVAGSNTGTPTDTAANAVKQAWSNVATGWGGRS